MPKPTTHVARNVPASQATYLQLLHALGQPDLSMSDLESLGQRGVPETLSVALIRAQACEPMGHADGAATDSDLFFLLGVWAVLDAIVGCPMSELVERLSLGQAIGDALLDRPNPVHPSWTPQPPTSGASRTRPTVSRSPRAWRHRHRPRPTRQPCLGRRIFRRLPDAVPWLRQGNDADVRVR